MSEFSISHNQGGNKHFIAKVPENPRSATNWECKQIFSHNTDSEMLKRGNYPSFKGINEHEGLAKADIDGDGRLDIIAGGRWFKHIWAGSGLNRISLMLAIPSRAALPGS